MFRFCGWLIFFAIIFTAINFANCDSENEEDSEDFENDCPDHFFGSKMNNSNLVKGKVSQDGLLVW